MATSYSSYPDAIDGYSTLPLRRNLIDEIRAEDVNRLRDAIVKIEQELGLQPSGVFATVRARLDDVSDASASIESHLADTIDAHDASAISLLDSGGNYASTEVESALAELAAVLPSGLDVVGQDTSGNPNSGIPSFVGSTGTLHVFNTGAGSNDVKKTQPVNVTGVHILEVGSNNGTGTAQLRLTNHSPATVAWRAPGDASFGTGVDISSLATGEVTTLSSNDTTKSIRITRNSISLPTSSPQTDDFDVLQFDSATGSYSLTGTGIVDTNKATRTATTSTNTSRNQFVVGGVVYPADQGTLVLQRKLRLASADFIPIAVLNLSAVFTEANRTAGQDAYVPSLQDYDTVTLFDRLPARGDYETLSADANGDAVYDNFDLSAPFPSQQIAKYLIPVSNATIALGQLQAPTDTTASEIENKVAAYRMVHYKAGVTDFTGEPAASDILSIADALGAVNDGDNNVRISNVYVDSDTARPTISNFVVRPVLDAEVVSRIISGVRYYNSDSDLFDVELRSGTDLFANTYLNSGILTLSGDAFDFGSVDGYGQSISVTNMLDDGYVAFSDSNVPLFTDRGFYLANGTINSENRLVPDGYSFSTRAVVSATLNDPFGAGTQFDSYGVDASGNDIRILVNTWHDTRATNTIEYLTDESRRVGTSENFEFELDVGQYVGAGTNGTLVDWDASSALGAGELQCGGLFAQAETDIPGLVYPQEDYTTGIRPLQQGGADYSAFGGARTYQRLFNLGKTINSGKLRVVSSGTFPLSFNNITYTNSSRPVKIEIKVPGFSTNSTGWLDISKPFQTNAVFDGDGCLAGAISGAAGDLVIPFTFGSVNNADTNDMVAIRITYAPVDGGTNVADALAVIISRIELLEL